MRGKFRALCVDEFQDLDEAQYRLMRLVAPESADLCVIGDPDQAIYGFRGADASSFARVAKDYPAAKTLRLRKNYRSSGTIVQAASQVIATNAEPSLAEIVREMHDRIAIHAAPTERAEAEFVVKEIEALLGGHSFSSIDSGRGQSAARTDVAFGDIAILYRTEAQSAALVEAFARSGMPFATSARRPLADNPAVAAILAEIAACPWAPLADALSDAAKAAGDGERAEALRWLTELAASSGSDRAHFLEAVAIADESDFFDARADRVALLTMHAAKGLEFSVVFVVGLEDGIVPLTFGAADDANVAEERRLFYVAMTRAKDRLFLTRAEERLWRGKRRKHEASPFLTDIEAELLRDQPKRLPRRRPEAAQLALF